MRANSAVDASLLLDRIRLRTLVDGPGNALAPITLLHAPSGYGKTTLATQFVSTLASGEFHVQHVRCASNSLPAFWNLLRARLAGGDPSANEHPELTAHEWVAERVAALTAPTLLVFDAYERVSSAEVDLALLELSNLTDFLHCLVLARSVRLLDGPLCADRVRTISARDLAFTPTEINDLAARHTMTASPSVTQALGLTEGWPLAVNAVLRAEDLVAGASVVEQNSSSRTALAKMPPRVHPALARFSADSLELLSPPARTILLAASLVDTLSLEQAAASTEISEAEAEAHVQALLDFGVLAATKLTHRKVFRIHPAVRTTVAAAASRAYSAPARASLVRDSARERETLDPFSAFKMYLESASLTDAEEVLAAHFTVITDHGAECTLSVKSLPEDVLHAYPTFAAARLSLEYSDPTVSPQSLQRLAELMRTGAELRLANIPGSDAPLFVAHRLQVMIGERMHGNVLGALAIAQELESRLLVNERPSDGRSPQPRRGRPDMQPVFLSELGFTAFIGGDAALAKRTWERLHTQMEAPPGITSAGFALPPPSATMRHTAWKIAALYGLAIVEANEGDFLTAAERLARADAVQQESGAAAPLLSWMNGEVARAHLAYEYTDEALLRQAVERIAPWSDRMEHWPMVLMAEVETTRYLRGPDWAIPQLRAGIASIKRERHGVGVWGGYLALYQALLNTTLGNLAVSQRILDALPADNSFVQIERARLALFSGDNVRAILEAQKIGLAALNKRQQMDKYLIGAVAAWGCDRPAEAFEGLRRSGELIQKCGLSMMLRGVPYAPLVELTAAARAAGIIDLTGLVDNVPLQSRCVAREKLTGMEQRALETMVTHPPLAAAAESLSIAAATMKRHRLAVYRKLHVGSRDEAILQATRMGLLKPHLASPDGDTAVR